MPNAPSEFLDQTSYQTSFALCTEEANYLIERIQSVPSKPPTLLSLLIQPDRFGDISEMEKPWNNRILNEAPTRLQSTLKHARNFARLTLGANLTYNLHLAVERGAGSVETEMREQLQRWLSSVQREWRETLQAWDWGDLREVLSRATGHSINFESTVRNFLEKWRRHVLRATGIGDLQSRGVCNLIRSRERRVKGPRARLSNRNALENWDGRPSGTSLQTYRWSQVRRFASDITRPINL